MRNKITNKNIIFCIKFSTSNGLFKDKLETVSIAEPLQNRQHAREASNAVNTRRERE